MTDLPKNRLRVLMIAVVPALWVLTLYSTQITRDLPRPVIAVLENPQGRAGVRVLFSSIDSSWISLSTFSAYQRVSVTPGMEWTITRNGKAIGSLRLSNWLRSGPDNWTFPRDMVLDVAPDQELPLIPNTEEDYWGWLRPPAFRPLVLVNGSWTQDPDGWAESSRDSDLREQLYPAFRAVNDSVFHCPKTYLDVVFYDYQWTDLIQVGAYRDRRGRVLVGLELDINKYGCDGPPGPDWSIHWFLVAEEPVLIGNELEFVDAGDYNGDSKSEVLFWHSGYNEDGYSIFYEDFTRRSDYWWNYH